MANPEGVAKSQVQRHEEWTYTRGTPGPKEASLVFARDTRPKREIERRGVTGETKGWRGMAPGVLGGALPRTDERGIKSWG